ncbi:MAG: S-layer homology domain-containing protein [Defluviitaleaceae bacterium]|nr:S-layer homology domain-containing protein [Defluviitaleaceae bacterium]
MKVKKKIFAKEILAPLKEASPYKAIAPIAIAATITLSTNVLANTFTDITPAHWAYSEVVSVTNRGIMNRNNSGAFRPNSPIDKFETSRILALVARFNEAPQSFINYAVSNHQASLNAVSSRFDRWNANVNREVAFLLELGVLTNADINNFIVVNNNSEELRALSRQEAAVFLARAANLSSHIGTAPAHPFSDNSSIATGARPYVDFLRTNAIVSGDGYGNFVPNAALNRASFALMIYRAISLQEALGASWVHPNMPGWQTLPTLAPITTPPPANILPPPTPPQTPSIAITQPQPEIPNISTNLTGIVYKIDEAANFLAVQIRFLTPAGIEHSTILGLRLAANAELLRGEQTISLSSIEEGDSVSLKITDGRITNINTTERNRSFTATLITVRGNALIVNYRGNNQEIGIKQNAIIERQGQGVVPISAFRVGDQLDIIVEENKATNIFAFGTRETVDGTVRELSIENNITRVVLETSSGERILYRRGTLTGVYAASRVRFQLDSSEILSFSILNQ